MNAIHSETQMVNAQSGESIHKDLDTFVLVVMSHGAKGSIIGLDDVHVELSDMIDLLSPKNFPALQGKPKIVIIQACAGGMKTEHFFLLNVLMLHNTFYFRTLCR